MHTLYIKQNLRYAILAGASSSTVTVRALAC